MSALDGVLARARSLGFDLAGIVPIGPPERGAIFADWLAAGSQGEMAYLAARAAERMAPAARLPTARSLILLAANYHPGPAPIGWPDPARGRFARYSWPADYHDVIKPRLYALDAFIREQTGRTALGKVCVDSAPLLERDFAAQAGLGFIGRNTCLITPGVGSWTFLAALAVPEDLTPFRHREGGPVGGCGRCTRCLDACPTRAFVAPHVLDARRCISYLTIELRGPIPRDLRSLMGNWVFGCDICQEVCPYNRAAPSGRWSALAPDLGRAAPALIELLALDAAAFRVRFHGTAILRARRRGLVRNACVAAGNWGNSAAVPALTGLLTDFEPLVRGHAAWALGRIGGHEATEALRWARAKEQEPEVIVELDGALNQ